MMKLPRQGTFISQLKRLFHSGLPRNQIHVCIVGSGPAGFYTAQQVLKNSNVKVDIYEKLPVPFGLVRFGVAPDHPEVKNVINTFTTTASHQNCSFIGNVCVGKDISIQELRDAYNCVVLSYGAEEDRRFNIAGEDLPNVLSARKFVGWYNGLPENASLKVNLDVDTAVVVGQGNVALDVARVLLTPVDQLKETDITEHALEALSRSRVRRVALVGRRGPLQAAFTIKELREMVKLPGTRPLIQKNDLLPLKDILPSLPRPRKRLTELMMTTSEADPTPSASTEWELKFLRSPVAILSEEQNVKGVRFGINRLEGSDNPTAVLTDDTEDVDCGMILRSIGYKSIPIDSSLPFDKKKGIYPNTAGRVSEMQGVYCSGWVKTGPVGVIVSTMNSSFETGQSILSDIESRNVPLEQRPGKEFTLNLLKNKGCNPVSFEDWKKIDSYEQEAGKKTGKPREKIITIAKMLEVVTS